MAPAGMGMPLMLTAGPAWGNGGYAMQQTGMSMQPTGYGSQGFGGSQFGGY
jgi:hypothetical protein